MLYLGILFFYVALITTRESFPAMPKALAIPSTSPPPKLHLYKLAIEQGGDDLQRRFENLEIPDFRF